MTSSLLEKSCPEYLEVKKDWEIDQLRKDLALVKGYTDQFGDWEPEQRDFSDFQFAFVIINI